MDADAREQWKWKFYRLVLHLNAVILGIALTVLAVFWKAPDSVRIPAMAVLIVLDVLLLITFRRKYAATKAWLDEHSLNKKDD